MRPARESSRRWRTSASLNASWKGKPIHKGPCSIAPKSPVCMLWKAATTTVATAVTVMMLMMTVANILTKRRLMKSRTTRRSWRKRSQSWWRIQACRERRLLNTWSRQSHSLKRTMRKLRLTLKLTRAKCWRSRGRLSKSKRKRSTSWLCFRDRWKRAGRHWKS